MSIERAERLKRELTDKWVVVADGVPELRRFVDLTGRVKTVNMNCRVLVEFDGPVDIGWYDIDPNYLTVVDGPRPKKSAATASAVEKAPPAKPAASSKPSSAAGGSPLDKIRAAGGAAAGSPLDKIRAAGAAAAPASAAPNSGSPLDKIRAAGAGAKSSAKDPVAEPAAVEVAAVNPGPAAASAPVSNAAAATGSPLDRIRAMGPAQKK